MTDCKSCIHSKSLKAGDGYQCTHKDTGAHRFLRTVWVRDTVGPCGPDAKLYERKDYL